MGVSLYRRITPAAERLSEKLTFGKQVMSARAYDASKSRPEFYFNETVIDFVSNKLSQRPIKLEKQRLLGFVDR